MKLSKEELEVLDLLLRGYRADSYGEHKEAKMSLHKKVVEALEKRQ
jgi:hypothetical protein